MVPETRKQSMAGMEHHSKDTHFRWKIKWRLEYLGALCIMGEMALYLALLVADNSYTLLCEHLLPHKAHFFNMFTAYYETISKFYATLHTIQLHCLQR